MGSVLLLSQIHFILSFYDFSNSESSFFDELTFFVNDAIFQFASRR